MGPLTMAAHANDGVVYKLDTTGHETVLYSFTGAPMEATPRRA